MKNKNNEIKKWFSADLNFSSTAEVNIFYDFRDILNRMPVKFEVSENGKNKHIEYECTDAQKDTLFAIYMLIHEYHSNTIKWTQEKSQNFYYAETPDGELLKSYSTICGYIDKTEQKFYEYGKYSQTTSKQITMYYKRYYSNYERVYIDYYNPLSRF